MGHDTFDGAGKRDPYRDREGVDQLLARNGCFKLNQTFCSVAHRRAFE